MVLDFQLSFLAMEMRFAVFSTFFLFEVFTVRFHFLVVVG